MSKSAGKTAAILLCHSPTQPINFQSLTYGGISQHEQNYIKVSVAAYQMYHHSKGDINAHYVGHLWHDYSTGDFIHLMNNLDLAVSNFKKSPHYPFFPSPKKMHLCPGASNFINSTIPQISSNNKDEQTTDSYKRIELFLQWYMGQHWSQFMKKLAGTNPTLKQLQHLVATKGALFVKAGIFKLHYIFTVPTTRIHPLPSPIRWKVQQSPYQLQKLAQ